MAREEVYRPPEGIGTGMVENIIEAYSDGAIRALAQEPVQNAKDAGPNGGIVNVEYRLHRRWSKGKQCHLLTVTDHGTTGLCGKIHPSKEELKQLSEKQKRQLKWFYFERMFDSNKGGSDIGSRGQGKSVFLYHSQIPGNERRMMMLYDTLLKDGEYRLGEIAVYEDQYGILKKPYLNKDACGKIQENIYVNAAEDIVVPLGLESLKEVGTRIVIPCLSEDALKAVRDGSLARWMQYLWWRAIVNKELTITIVDENGDKIPITEPDWWQDDIWSGESTPPNQLHNYEDFAIKVHENDPIEGDIKVRRLVLLHEVELREKGRSNEEPDYHGIQIFRNGQCIETYWDDDFPIPRDEKFGMRAFIEFDEATEKQLQSVEKPQHDGFHNWRKNPMPKIKKYLVGRMGEFAAEKGWKDNVQASDESDDPLDSLLDEQIALTFITPSPSGVGRGGKGIHWELKLNVGYPDPNSTRVEWGNCLRNVWAQILCKPSPNRRDDMQLILDWLDSVGGKTNLYSGPANITTEEYIKRFGDFQLVAEECDTNQLLSPFSGVYTLQARIEVNGRQVKKAKRNVYVECDPPLRNLNEDEIRISISIGDDSKFSQKRIFEGEELRVQINTRNFAYEPRQCYLRVRLGEIVLVNELEVQLKGVPEGDKPDPVGIHYERLRFILPGQPVPPRSPHDVKIYPLEPGRHTIQAYLSGDRLPKTFSGDKEFYFEYEPPGSEKPELPFRVEDYPPGELFEDRARPSWNLSDAGDVLTYPSNYPVMEELLMIEQLPKDKREKGVMKGHRVFRCEAILNGLIEWALRPLETGNETRLNDLKNVINNKNVDNELTERCVDLLDELSNRQNDRFQYANNWRKTVAMMWVILRKAG